MDAPQRERGNKYDAVQRFLRSFGLAAAAARQVASAGEALRTQTRQTGVEYAATFDAATGAPLGVVLGGGASEVDIGEHIRAMAPGHSYFTVHTHPANTPPSDDDAAVLVLILVLNPPIQVAAVVGANSTWYALSAAAGRLWHPRRQYG